MKIILCGQKACGKTTIGSMTAGKLGIPFYDLDNIILERSCNEFKSCRQMYTQLGKEAFRKAEEEAFKDLESRLKLNKDSVASLGGGSLESGFIADNAPLSGTLVYLFQDETTLFLRMQKQGFPPFLLPDPKNKFNELFVKRDKTFRSLCSIIVDESGKDKEEVCQTLLEMF